MKEYKVTIGGLEHTLLLDEEDQKARFPNAKATGNDKVEVVPEKDGVDGEADDTKAAAKAAPEAPANKARTADSNK